MHSQNVVMLAVSCDREKADKVGRAMSEIGYYVLRMNEDMPEHGMGRYIHHNLGPGDSVLVLLSKQSTSSPWLLHDLASVIDYEIGPRAINVIPVYLERCKAPESLDRYSSVDCSRDFSRGIDTLIQRMNLAKQVHLRALSAETFETLVLDLLKAHGFKSIRLLSPGRDIGFDATARYSKKDPFGKTTTETWFVQIKAGQSVSDVRLLSSFLGHLMASSDPANGLFVTVGQLTSAAREWLADVRTRRGVSLRVLEGDELRQLILARPKLVEKYFGLVTTVGD